MPAIKSLFTAQAAYEAGILMGMFNRPAIGSTYLALCNSVSGGSFLWDAAATISQVIATEVLEANGYTRLKINPGNNRAISAANTATGVLTITGGVSGYTNEAPVFVFATTTSAVITPYEAGTIYYLKDVDPINNQVKLAATPGGATILPTTSGVTGNFIALYGGYDPATKKYTSLDDTAILTAVGGPVTYSDIVLVKDMNGSWANRPVSSLDTATGTFTLSSTHGFTTSDRVILTVDAGGTLPAISSPAGITADGRVFRVLSPSGSTFRLSVDGVNPVLFISNYTGTLRIRNGSGRVVSFTREDDVAASATRTIAAGTSRTFRHNRVITI